MPIDLEQYNQKVAGWKDGIVQESKVQASGLGISHRGNSPSKGSSVSKIKGKVTERDGATSKVSISFPRQLIYTHKGAGKGRGGTKGSRWIDKFGASHQTAGKSLGKMGTGGRVAKPFLNNALDGASGVNLLADIAAEELGAAIMNKLFI